MYVKYKKYMQNMSEKYANMYEKYAEYVSNI